MTTRRLFLQGLTGALITAPAVVSAASLMKIRPSKILLPVPPDPHVWYEPAGLYRTTAFDCADVQEAMRVIRQSVQALRFEDREALRKAVNDYQKRLRGVEEDLYRTTFRPKNPDVARWLDS